MSATMARQGRWVPLEQSDMRLALNMAKLAKGWFSLSAMEKMQYGMKSPRTKVRGEKKQGVAIPWHGMVKAAIERRPAMRRQNHTDACHPVATGTGMKPQTHRRPKGMDAPTPDRLRQLTLDLMPHEHGMPPAPPGDNEGTQRFHIDNLPPGYVYSHTSLPRVQFSTLDAYAQDIQHDTDCNPDMLTDEGTSTG